MAAMNSEDLYSISTHTIVLLKLATGRLIVPLQKGHKLYQLQNPI